MTGASCARCERQQPRDDEHWSLDEGANETWAAVGGEDVCPGCQTPAERDEITRRVVATIQQEIDRRQVEGAPPDRYEPPLVGYAMEQRNRVSAGQSSAEAPTEGDVPEHVPGADHVCLRVDVTGAFLTGRPLAVRIDTYEQLQSSLRSRLHSPRWCLEGLRGEGGTFQSGGGFSQAMPLVIARREGTDLLPMLRAAVQQLEAGEVDHREQVAHVLKATPRRLTIDIYDLGVAVMDAEFVVTVAGTELAAAARAVKELTWLRPLEGRPSPLATALREIASSTAEEFGAAVEAVARDAVQPAWLGRTPGASPATVERQDSDSRGRLLWLHPIHLLRTSDRSEDLAVELTPPFRKVVDLGDGSFSAGVGWSAVVVTSRSWTTEAPVRLTALHWAYYALYMEIDRGLLAVLDDQRWSASARLGEFERDAEHVFADYLRVVEARARLDSALTALGGDELAIWDAVAEVQRFDALIDAVDRKLEALGKLADHRVEQASAKRSRRIADVLGVLSVMTLVTVVGGIIGVLAGSVSPGSVSPLARAALLALAAALAVFVYWVAFRRSLRVPPSSNPGAAGQGPLRSSAGLRDRARASNRQPSRR